MITCQLGASKLKGDFHFSEQIQVTNKGELQVEEDAFRNFSDIAQNNQARTDTEAEFSNFPLSDIAD